MGTDLWQCALMVTLQSQPLRNQAASTMTHSVTLSWHWANESLPYPNNAECLARKWQVSILKSLVSLTSGWNPEGSDSLVSQNGKLTFYSLATPSDRKPQSRYPDLSDPSSHPGQWCTRNKAPPGNKMSVSWGFLQSKALCLLDSNALEHTFA